VPTRENYPGGLCGAGHKLNDLELVSDRHADLYREKACCQLPTPRLRRRPAAACNCYRR
jgi:hypothetical protein